MVACLGGVESAVAFVIADAGADRGDERADFIVAEHFVEAGLFDIEELAANRKDGLGGDRKSTRLNSSHVRTSRMPSSA